MAIKKVLKPRVGAHLSIGKGLDGTAGSAVDMGVETFQIFLRNPRGSGSRDWSPKEVEIFNQTMNDHDITPRVAHIPYIVNPASGRTDLYELAERVITEDLIRGDMIGISYLVLHPGSRGDASIEEAIVRLCALLDRTLDKYAGPTTILLETMAGMGKEIGVNFDEMRMAFQCLKHSDRIGLCIDTCHMMAAGYDTSTEAGIESMLAEAESTVGLDRIKVVHANDSLKGIGSHLDRHAPIGTGFVGAEGFTHLLSNKFLQNLPFILETPSETMADDLALLKKIRAEVDG